MFQWMRELNAGERRTMAGCFGGWSLDALDVQIYSFAIPTLLTTWQISRDEAGLLGTITLVVSSLGGWFAGALSDRYAEVRALLPKVLDKHQLTAGPTGSRTVDDASTSRGSLALTYGGP